MSLDRDEWLAGMRAFCDWLEEHDEIDIPEYGFGHNEFNVIDFYFEEKADIARWVRAIPGEVEKEHSGAMFYANGRIGGLHVRACVSRSEVCERVVVGTEKKVREQLPEGVEYEKVEYDADIIEWKCTEPLLAVES